MGKLANWWEAGGASGIVAAYRAVRAVDYAASKVNLTGNAAYNLREGSAPDFDPALGWVSGAAAHYLKTGILPAPNWSYLIQFTDAVYDNTAPLFGEWSAVSGYRGIYAQPVTAGSGQVFVTWANTGATQSGDPPIPHSGNLAIVGQKVFYDGADTGIRIPYDPTGIVWRELYLLGVNNDEAPYAGFKGNVQSFAVYDNVLPDAQVAAVVSAMADLVLFSGSGFGLSGAIVAVPAPPQVAEGAASAPSYVSDSAASAYDSEAPQ